MMKCCLLSHISGGGDVVRRVDSVGNTFLVVGGGTSLTSGFNADSSLSVSEVFVSGTLTGLALSEGGDLFLVE